MLNPHQQRSQTLQEPEEVKKPMTLKFKGVHTRIIQTILMFDQIFFVRALKLSRGWRDDVLQAFDDYCNPIEN